MGKPTGKVAAARQPDRWAVRQRIQGAADRRGYAPVTTAKHMIHLGHLSRWLEVRGMDAADLTRDRLGQFVVLAGFGGSPDLLAAEPAARARDSGRAGCGISTASGAAGLGS